MVQFVHPAQEDITLTGLLDALADPVRRTIVRSLLQQEGCMSCTEAMPCASIAKSSLSNHFRVLRDAGLVRTVKRGVENRNTVRKDEIEARFPGLLQTILAYGE